MNKKQIAQLLLTGLSLSLHASIGQAQAADAPKSDKSTAESTKPSAFEEIVVTARRTEENIQEVPLSITAFSADDLARQSITSVTDLSGKVGSLAVGPSNTMRNTESPNIRGQGSTFGANPGVVMYWSEVPLPTDSFIGNQGGPGMFFDIENLQVLKGPQGTLFGRNTTGGALIIEPAKPKNVFSAHVTGERGNYNDHTLEAVVNAPLIEDRLLFRIAGQKVHRDGFTKDIVSGKDYDNRNYWTGRLGLTLKFTDDIENTLLAYRTMRDENGTGNVLDAMNPAAIASFLSGSLGQPLIPNVPPEQQFGCTYYNGQTHSTNCGQDIAAAQQARGIRHIQLSADTFDRLTTSAAVDTFSAQLTDTLKLRNIMSDSFYRRQFSWDQDGSNAQLNDIVAGNYPSSNTKTFTEEFQIQGSPNDYGLSYVTGVYYETHKPQGMQENSTIALFAPITQTYRIKTESLAGYAQGTYDFGVLNSTLKGWSVTAGIRRTRDKESGHSFLDAPGTTKDLDVNASVQQYATTWLLSTSYQFDKAILYGKIARGYKAGGFTGLAANPADYYYKPEYVTNYEIGVKSDTEIASLPLRLNAATFYSKYTDMQRVTAESYNGTFGAATFNAGKSVIKGVELEGMLAVTDRLQLTGNYTYMDAYFVEFMVPRSSASPQLDCTGSYISNGQLGNYSCIPFTDTPKQQYSVGFNYKLPIDKQFGDVEAAFTYSHVDKRYTAPITVPQAEPGAWLDSFGILNGSISWSEVFKTRFDLQVFGTNLTNQTYRVSNSNTWNELGYQNTIWSEPRMYGVKATYRWGD